MNGGEPLTERRANTLAGQVAVITGGARGIGRAFALRLAELGAAVAVFDVDFGHGDTEPGIAEEVVAAGGRALERIVDVGDAGAVKSAVADVVAKWGHLDVAVCNAGGGSGDFTRTRASVIEPTEFDVVLRRNLLGTVHTCQAVAAQMTQQGSGRIVTMSSLSARRPRLDGGYAHYASAKAAIVLYTQNLAQELGPFGVTVNCLQPGYIATPRLLPRFEENGAEAMLSRVALRRFGTPEDCAGALEFLVTDLGSYVTGAVIRVDGGAA